MSGFFHTFLYEPIYNLLVFIVSIVPHGDVGLAVIMVTIIIRFVVMPLSLAAMRTQRGMQEVQPKLDEIKEQYKDDKERLAKETFALYREHHINPFAGFATLFVQVPILIGLYWVFRTENLPAVNTDFLYYFVHAPQEVSTLFLGLFSLTAHSLILAVIAAAVQSWSAHHTIPKPVPPKAGTKPSMQHEFGKAMTMQARYVLPIIIGVVAYSSGAIALYFITSGLFGIAESFVKRKQHLPPPETILS
jgi:YidC/Oxa1 family membrane protein insertase